MTVVVTTWSVICYLEQDSDREVLRRIYKRAWIFRRNQILRREPHITLAIVGILSKPKHPDTVCFVALLHCGRAEVERVLAEAKVPLESVTFEECLLNEEEAPVESAPVSITPS